MKKLVSKITCLTCSLLLLFTCFACTPSQTPNGDNVLEVMIWDAGYGIQWCEDMLESFKEEPWVKEKYPNLVIDFDSAMLNKEFPQAKFTSAGESTVGGLIGMEFTKSAIIALILSFLGIIAYVTFRYEFAYGMAAVMALVHDVIIAIGIYVVCGRELSLTVVAAVLTIIGYSINDTIVIFDRIREAVGLYPEKPYRDIVNIAVNDTLNRTMLTSITTLLVVLVLFFFGGAAINDFVLVMMLGILIGTYSSICISSPIVSVWHKKIGKK